MEGLRILQKMIWTLTMIAVSILPSKNDRIEERPRLVPGRRQLTSPQASKQKRRKIDYIDEKEEASMHIDGKARVPQEV